MEIPGIEPQTFTITLEHDWIHKTHDCMIYRILKATDEELFTDTHYIMFGDVIENSLVKVTVLDYGNRHYDEELGSCWKYRIKTEYKPTENGTGKEDPNTGGHDQVLQGPDRNQEISSGATEA